MIINKETLEISPNIFSKRFEDIRDFLIDANVDFVLKYNHIFSQFIKDFIKSKEPTLLSRF